MLTIRSIGVLATAAIISACAGRDAVPVQTVQATDEQLSCEQISAEQQQISAKVNTLIKEDEEAHNRNIAVGVVGAILFWPALFALDTGEAEETEIAALRSRSEHLNSIAVRKNCGVTTTAAESKATEVAYSTPAGDKTALQQELQAFVQSHEGEVKTSLQSHLEKHDRLPSSGLAVYKVESAAASHLDGKSYNLTLTYMLTAGGTAAPGKEVRQTETFQVLFDGSSVSFI